jgi:hypothetical protein
MIAAVGMAMLSLASAAPPNSGFNMNYYPSFVNGVYTEGTLNSGDTGMA